MGAEVEEEGGQPRPPHARHIKKRALRNKALSVSFNEKDLRDFVGGFHKRKKKRRKEAQQKLQESQRIKRIEQRKKRKLERDFVLYGGAPPAAGSEPDECDDEHEQDDGVEPIAPVSGTTMYDNGDTKVIVTTSEISREEENHLTEKTLGAAPPATEGSKKKHNVPVSKKKAFKRAPRHRSQPKLQRKRDRKKGGKKNNKIH